ncbi:MAG TPA: FG-GAP-like repeat-containing protein [Pyrinomonadaceae bacterium]|jgi:hypothetical protein|nr:FG-GAP-like repeat-containing protein [Pyrinomonadaceae bacterium]
MRYFVLASQVVSSRLSSGTGRRVAIILLSVAVLAACYGLSISPAAAQSFATKVDYPTGSNSFPHSVAIADLNGDGKPDLAVAVQFFDAVDVFINNGNGTFAAGVYYNVTGEDAAVVAGDFNGDGKPDLATANSTGSGSGTGSVSVLINNGNGTFATKVDYTMGAASNPASIAAGDFNGDGKPDLAVADYAHNVVSVFINNGDGTFAAKVDYPTDSGPSSVAVGDFNSDGKPDLATANYSGNTMSVLINNGNGTFATKVDYTTGAASNPASIAAGDFNGDGKPDLSTANSGNNVMSVFINNGNGTFATKVDYPTGASPQSVAVGDFNGDSKLDLAVANTTGNTVSVFKGNGNGTFNAKVDFGTGSNSQPISVAAGDLNADGKIDLATANYNNSMASVFINTTPAVTCVAPPSGMVAWYPAEGNANDIKGGNNGTPRASTAYAAGKVGQAFQFSTNNGSASTQVNVADSPSLRMTNGLTVDAWINPTAPGVADNPILVKGNLSSANSQPYSILFVNAGAGDNRIIFRVGNNSTFDSLVSNGNVLLNTYTHIAVTYDGTTMSLYVNGALDASKTTTIGTLNQNSLPLSIGGGAADFAGAVDELEIYNRALSQTEIQSIYDAGTAGKCRTGSSFPGLPTYDATSDFSSLSNPSPLNGGVWSYGSAASLGAAFTLYANAQTSVGGGTFGNGFIDAWDVAANTPPGVFHNTSNSTQTYAGTVNQPANQLSLQPGSYSFVRWTAPTTGEYVLQGQFARIDSTPTTTDVYIIRNYGTATQTTYFSGFINAANATAPYNIDFVARNGDTIDLIVGPGTNAGTGETSPATDSTGLSAAIIKVNNVLPTAADATISGQVTTGDGTPVSGTTVNLSGTQSRRTITDLQGNYRFDNVETNGFYTVTPSRANYSFGPAERSFSLTANKTDAVFTAQPTSAQTQNPLDTGIYFVRQQYLDFLGREPDEGGLNYWTTEIDRCGTDAVCLSSRRIGVSAAFIIESEFQQTGSFVYRLYKGALGRQPLFTEFSADRSQVIGGTALEANKTNFADAFVQRPEFLQKYGNAAHAEAFVDLLIETMRQASGVDASGQRSSLIARYNTGGNIHQSRSLVLQSLIENESFRQAEYNKAFVLMQYFGYLRRDPEQAGYDFWLNVLNNREPNNYRGMVCSFITSAEYQDRFGPLHTHTNQECR